MCKRLRTQLGAGFFSPCQYFISNGWSFIYVDIHLNKETYMTKSIIDKQHEYVVLIWTVLSYDIDLVRYTCFVPW